MIRSRAVFVSLFFGLALLGSDRAFAVTVVVTSTADTLTGCALTGTPTLAGGGCTLRDAITLSNANPAPPNSSNFIQFNIPGSGVQTITLGSPLPFITTAATRSRARSQHPRRGRRRRLAHLGPG